MKTKSYIFGAMSTAIICIATFIKITTANGYIHLGDGVLLALTNLLGPIGILASGLGSAICDLISGYPIYILPTFIIKSLMAICILYLPGKIIFKLCIAELIMVILYFLFEAATMTFASAILSVIPNIVQGISGIIIAYILINVFEKTKIKQIINK